MGSVYISTLVLVASFIGTTTGFGTSTILVPILSLSYSFPETLLFVGIIHWFGDIWKMFFFKKGINWKLILLFGIPGLILSFIASRLPTIIEEKGLKRTLGIFLVGYVTFIFLKPKWKIAKNNINAAIGGGLSGFFAGIFGVGGAVRGAFLSTFNLEKSVYIFTSGAIAFLIDSSRLLGYKSSGITLNAFSLPILFISVLISLLGAYLAKKLVDKIPQKKFRLLVAVALLLIGIRYLTF